jgi:hypothetical protein
MLSRYLTTSMLLLSAILTSALGTALVGKTLSAYQVVQAAQEEGARFPRGNPQAPPRTFRSMGTASRKCVEFPPNVDSKWVFNHPVSRRSGEFETGAQISALKAGQAGKVWWDPLHKPRPTKATLIVRGTRLDQPEITSRFVSSRYAYPVTKDGHAHLEEYAFYPTGFSLPSPGRWLLIATSGDDWGCFIVSVQ